MKTNYRSTPEILNLANGVLLAQPKGRHFDKELEAARGHMEKPYVVQAMDDREQAEFIVKRARALHEDEGVSLSNIAVLYRSHFIAVETQIALARAGIPYHITSGRSSSSASISETWLPFSDLSTIPPTARLGERIAILLPKVGEKGAQKIHAAALTHAKDFQKDFIDALGAEDVRAKVAKDAKTEWDALVISLGQVSESMRTGTPSDAVETAIDGWYGDYLKGAYADYMDRLEELKALVGFAQRFEETQDFLAQILLLNSETSDRHVDQEMDAVKL